MRFASDDEIRDRKACDHGWAWVENTCRAVVAYQTGGEDPELVLEAFDEVSAQIEAKGMTGDALIECTISWAHERIQGGKS